MNYTYPNIKQQLKEENDFIIIILSTWVRIKRNKKFYKIFVESKVTISNKKNIKEAFSEINYVYKTFIEGVYNTYHLFFINKNIIEQVNELISIDKNPINEKDRAYIRMKIKLEDLQQFN